MKKIIISALIITCMGTAVSAQSTGGGRGTSSPSTTEVVNTPTTKSVWGKNKRVKGNSIDTIGQRGNYKSKQTGQKATPTGQDATGVNSTHAPYPKNAGTQTENASDQ